MDLAEFDIDRATFELRYDKAFAIWDRAGALMNAFIAQYPDAKFQDANPGRISFILKPNTEIVIELEKAYIIRHGLKRTLEDLTEVAGNLTKLITTYAEVKAFTRIGTRLIYRKRFESLAAATEKLISLGSLKVPSGQFFGIQVRPETVAYSSKWDGPATGVRVGLATRTQKVEFSPNPGFAEEVQDVKKEHHELALDVDYYATTTVLIDQFRAEDWIKNVVHLVNRDIRHFLGVG